MDDQLNIRREKISIIIPCYNDANYIEKSVNSALDQDYKNKEIIVVDDGSNTETKEVLKRLKSKIDFLLTQKNKGAGTARNRGISVANGEYILTLDSDDYFEETFCTKAVQVFRENENAKIVSCYANRFNREENVTIKHSNATLKDFLKFNQALGNALFYKSDWEEVGGYDEKMTEGYEDWEFYIRILKYGGYSHIIPEILFNYRLREVSNSTRADKIKYKLLKYIYIKHKDLYTDNFEILIGHLLNRLEIVEKSERKNLNKLEFRIGKKVLTPLRKIRKIFER